MSSNLLRISLLSLPLMATGAYGASQEVVLPTVKATTTPDTETYRAEAVSAAKTDTPLRDVPQSISVVTRKSLDDLNTQNIGEAMQYVPGVSMAQGEGNRETPVIRGNSSTGDFFLDVMRDDVQYYRDLYNIERIEVLKGPGGSLFGRGGVGGIINRVSKEAGFNPVRNVGLQLGTDSNKRATVDVGQGIAEGLAFRLNSMYEDSDSYRDDVDLKRYGINPTLTWLPSDDTKVVFGVEYFHDERVADRGVSSYMGRPLHTDQGEFFGDPRQSPTETTVKMANLLVEHRLNDAATVRNRTRYADYDKFYQNVFAGAVNASGTMVSLAGYNNDTQRQNFFNQTDLDVVFNTGDIVHKLLTGIELGQQKTDNFRQTGYFDSVAAGTTSIQVPVARPRTTLPVSWRQSVTDADNSGTATIAALYVQDEVALTEKFSVTAGLRYDNFDVDFKNHRNGDKLNSNDDFFSPRVGVVYKPIEVVSLYASYSLSYQPRAGDQLASLSVTNASLDAEEFENYEIGAKWDLLPSLSLTAAVFRLDRSNVAIADPTAGLPGGAPAGTMMLTDGQRNQGIELGLTGNITNQWSVIAAAAYQDAEISSDQSATVRKGAELAALPKTTVSLWNRYDLSDAWGVGLGVIYRDKIFAATENLAAPASNVTLPSFTRVDGAVYYKLNKQWQAQLNVENLFDKEYYQFAHSNTNITPASPRAARVSVTASF